MRTDDWERSVDAIEAVAAELRDLDPTPDGSDANITLLVVDDHPVVRSGIVSLLSAEPDIDVVAECGDGAEAIDAALRLQPAAILMDLRMPVLDGVGAITLIRAEWPDAAIVVLTTYDTDEAIVRAIEAGASGYLLKDAPPVDAVRRAAAVARAYDTGILSSQSS